ncbi:transglycosylase SLT domain-containing protein [Pseudomonas oryzihabitans]|uniref:transglycosylase SLT domain-containing protein n=1 Tax=Pseudomonas oryzihabitans TaxID=47885 RepID=UPI0028569E0D|nr:transglycosylase SLT domain-containing protein [Pseudomonas psychrotolerans]MDR6680184.1 soluble lytic murein transglycosylase-like protein [Pseudomonas psychrotolerans]
MAATMIKALGAGLLLQVAAATVLAAETPPPAYQLAAYQAGIPSEVLYSVALQESGTRLRGHGQQLVPWPWTLNVAGAGYRFATRADACTALLVALRTVDAKRVDVGLMQINMGWNGQRFGVGAHPCTALDPYKNLKVGTDILAELRAEGGDWFSVAGRYHRPAGGAPAARYRQLFAKHLSRVTGLHLLATNP